MARYRTLPTTGMLKRGAMLAGVAALGLSWALPTLAQGQPAAAAKALSLQELVEAFSIYLLGHWQMDPKLKDTPPPQIIANISSKSKVVGGCFGLNEAGRPTREIMGTSYCPSTNTIFAVQEDLQYYRDTFGDVAVGYALAHEYGHYLQSRFNLKSDIVVSELQADCLAGNILGQNYQQLGLNQDDIIAVAVTAYNLGDESHGTGAQRAYAVLTGLGHSDELTCATNDMIKLSKNQVSDPRFKNLEGIRSAGEKPVSLQNRGPNLKSISGSLGI